MPNPGNRGILDDKPYNTSTFAPRKRGVLFIDITCTMYTIFFLGVFGFY